MRPLTLTACSPKAALDENGTSNAISSKAPNMNSTSADLKLELRSANGSSMKFHEADAEHVRKALPLLAAPRLFAQPHRPLASQHCASMISGKGIDMIFVSTSAQLPLKFPLNLPVGRLDIVEQSHTWPDNKSAAIDDQDGQPPRHCTQVEIHTLAPSSWRRLKTNRSVHFSLDTKNTRCLN